MPEKEVLRMFERSRFTLHNRLFFLSPFGTIIQPMNIMMEKEMKNSHERPKRCSDLNAS